MCYCIDFVQVQEKTYISFVQVFNLAIQDKTMIFATVIN